MAKLNRTIKATIEIENIKELEDLINKLNEDVEKIKKFQPIVKIINKGE